MVRWVDVAWCLIQTDDPSHRFFFSFKFRIFRLAELDVGYLISTDRREHFAGADPDVDPWARAIIEEELYRGRVKGRVVAVKHFRGPSQVN